MKDPVRLLEQGASDFEAELLRAGRADAMPSGSRAPILAGLGLGGLLTASTVASGVRAGAKGWLVTAGVGAAGALAIWAGVRSSSPPPPQSAGPKPSHAAAAVSPAAPAPSTALAEPVAVTSSAPEPAPAAAATSKSVGRPSSSADTSLTAELAALEQARSAFLARDYAQALRSLDDYARRFPKRRLGSEATVLRIETLAARGDRDAAARIGRDFLQHHPNGPYAQRVRSVIGDAASPHAP